MDSPLVQKADALAHLVYSKTKNFPKDELFGITSQLRRAILSVPLNIIEGYARQNRKEFRHFLRISYGSLKEAKYILGFALEENYITQKDFDECFTLSEEVSRMALVVNGIVAKRVVVDCFLLTAY
ncbi:four helix bundle protein [Candidatus Uhrbacteria bacterium]|nr:four helix bundle protein [Candidatus Uhrbacteria bacterium]